MYSGIPPKNYRNISSQYSAQPAQQPSGAGSYSPVAPREDDDYMKYLKSMYDQAAAAGNNEMAMYAWQQAADYMNPYNQYQAGQAQGQDTFAMGQDMITQAQNIYALGQETGNQQYKDYADQVMAEGLQLIGVSGGAEKSDDDKIVSTLSGAYNVPEGTTDIDTIRGNMKIQQVIEQYGLPPAGKEYQYDPETDQVYTTGEDVGLLEPFKRSVAKPSSFWDVLGGPYFTTRARMREERKQYYPLE